MRHSPAVGERVDEEETAAGLSAVRGGLFDVRQTVTARVGDLDAKGAADDVERQAEVTAGHTGS